jgi:hypothetical protein
VSPYAKARQSYFHRFYRPIVSSLRFVILFYYSCLCIIPLIVALYVLRVVVGVVGVGAQLVHSLQTSSSLSRETRLPSLALSRVFLILFSYIRFNDVLNVLFLSFFVLTDAEGNYQGHQGPVFFYLFSFLLLILLVIVQKTEKAPRVAKGKKNPNAPKRPLSAYMFFSQDWRERIKNENHDAGFGPSLHCSLSIYALILLSIGEIGKLLGAKWKEMDDEDKKVCHQSFFSCSSFFAHSFYSRMQSKLPRTKCELNEKRKR